MRSLRYLLASFFIILFVNSCATQPLEEGILQKDVQNEKPATETNKEIKINEEQKPKTDQQAEEYKILLKSREFVPKEGIEQSFLEKIRKWPFERVHLLIQFYTNPSEQEKKTLENKGVSLLAYIPNYAWFASITPKNIDSLLENKNIRSVMEIIPDDKINPSLREFGVGSWAKNPDGTVSLYVLFFDDVSEADARNILKIFGKVEQETNILWRLQTLEKNINKLADNDAIQFIDNIYPPPTTNV